MLVLDWNKYKGMALKESQQILEAIKRSSRPLICVPENANADHFSTALGLFKVLEKLEKKPIIVSSNTKPSKTISFLDGLDKIKTSLENIRHFVIELDATKTKVNELTYEMKEDKLFVYLSPKKGFWDTSDVKTSSSGYRHDLIISIGSSDYDSFGKLYTENTDFFFRTPVINIDHSPDNEHFGQINIIDLTASACGEVCYEMIHAIEPGLIDEDIATAFLTGMISKTRSFKTNNVTPKTLQTASKLMSKGAKRDHIVKHLYKTRSVSTLRLWGRALGRLKEDETNKIVWTMLSQQDFMTAGAEEIDLVDVVDELIASSPKAKVIILIFEDADKNVSAIVRTEKPLDAINLCAPFKAVGTREEVRLKFSKKSIVQAEKEILTRMKEMLN
jgi:bifunctional oligoribonuclease and PAP phosphatase NrnA